VTIKRCAIERSRREGKSNTLGVSILMIKDYTHHDFIDLTIHITHKR